MAPPYLDEFKDVPGHLSALACLQQVRYLKLGTIQDSSICCQPAFSCLRLLHMDMLDWPLGKYPDMDLAGCPKLHSLWLSYSDENLEDEASAIDLRGIVGNVAPFMQLELRVAPDMRAFADFADWTHLAAVHITFPDWLHVKDWRVMQSAHDLVGALAGYLPMHKVTVDGDGII